MTISKNTDAPKRTRAAMPHQIFAKAWHSWGGKKHRGVVPPSASNIASKTRRVASQSASQHTEPQKRAGTPAPPASSVVLDAEQQKFLVCCGIFLQQAKSLGQEVELRAAIEGRFFAEWSIAVDKSMASTVALVQKTIHRELDWVSLSSRSITPVTSWQLVMAMSTPDIYLHTAPHLAMYQRKQQSLGLSRGAAREHHHDIYDRTCSEEPCDMSLEGEGSIDLTSNVDEEFFYPRKRATTPVDLTA